ncbi:MAG: hypothetical protein QM270_08505 [Bacillota bacterium]|nr:hypothetical protein [Bacillota bacterium]
MALKDEKVPLITYERPTREVPLWAVLQRSLIDAMNSAIDMVLENYLRPNGEFLWPAQSPGSGISVGSMDDVYESFHSWPLFYVLGGDDRFLQLAKQQFRVVNEQFSHYSDGRGNKTVEKDYYSRADWMHQGEGNQFFYHLNLADPDDEELQQLSSRFAGFFLNEDPSIAIPNFDPVHQVMTSPSSGSMGPAELSKEPTWGYGDWMDFYGLPFQDIPGVTTVLDLKDPVNARRMGEAIQERQSRSDTFVNLLSTSLIMNAYLHTGEDKYRDWVLAYAGAWQKRIEGNDGIIPDNCGPGGVVGENMGGRWWGGHYGWTWPHGFSFIAEAAAVAAENVCLLTGNSDYFSHLRRQTAHLLSMGVDINSMLYIPQKYADDDSILEYSIHNDNVMTRPDRVTSREDFSRKRQVNGWFEFAPLLPQPLTHAWFSAWHPDDLEMLRKARHHDVPSHEQIDRRCMEIFGGPEQGYQYYPSALKYLGGQDHALIGYHDGCFPDYPAVMMQYNINQVYRRLKEMREDRVDPSTYNDDYLQRRNPITTEGLVHLTMGGPLPLYNGGLLLVSVRYFDRIRRRPGLPPDVAALVSIIESDSIELDLVNLHPMEKRSLTILAGAYGEHQFSSWQLKATGQEQNREAESRTWGDEHVVDTNRLHVDLGPGSLLSIRLGMKRFANRPSYHHAVYDPV